MQFPSAILLTATCWTAVWAAAESGRCYDPRLDSYPYVSTRTAYERVHGNVSRLDSGCTPVQMWMLIRHGTRYPGKKIIPDLLSLVEFRDEIIANHKRGRGLLCPADLKNLHDWQLDPNLNVENAEILTPQGEEDLYGLAQRLRAAFPELLQQVSKTSQPVDYLFRATKTQRTQASLKFFAKGLLLGTSPARSSVEPPADVDALLLPQKNCPAWEAEYDGARVNRQRDLFTAGPEFQGLLRKIARRLGFNDSLGEDRVKAMYEMCRFEAAWYLNRTSAWCTLFTREDLQLIEYREDLDYYYYCGPGRSTSPKLACQLITDLFRRFNDIVLVGTGDMYLYSVMERPFFRAAAESSAPSAGRQPRAVFYFAHTVTLQLLMSALNIGKEPEGKLLASTYSTAADRKYRTSLLGPFATNVMAVLHRCEDSRQPHKVTFHVAEKLEQLDGCQGGYCDWSFLEQWFGREVEKCAEEHFCRSRGPSHDETRNRSSKLASLQMMVQLFGTYLTSRFSLSS